MSHTQSCTHSRLKAAWGHTCLNELACSRCLRSHGHEGCTVFGKTFAAESCPMLCTSHLSVYTGLISRSNQFIPSLSRSFYSPIYNNLKKNQLSKTADGYSKAIIYNKINWAGGNKTSALQGKAQQHSFDFTHFLNACSGGTRPAALGQRGP